LPDRGNDRGNNDLSPQILIVARTLIIYTLLSPRLSTSPYCKKINLSVIFYLLGKRLLSAQLIQRSLAERTATLTVISGRQGSSLLTRFSV